MVATFPTLRGKSGRRSGVHQQVVVVVCGSWQASVPSPAAGLPADRGSLVEVINSNVDALLIIALGPADKVKLRVVNWASASIRSPGNPRSCSVRCGSY